LSDGSHTFVVTATDGAGNTGSASSNWSVDYDPAPYALSFTSTPGTTTDQTSAHFGYSANDPDDPLVSLTFSCILDGTVKPCSPTSADVTGLAPQVGFHTFTVSATDPAGNTSMATFSWHVYYDTNLVAQQVVKNSPNYSATLRSGSATAGSGSPLAGQTVTFYAGQNGPNSTTLCSGITDSAGLVTCSADLLHHPERAGGVGLSYTTGVTAVFIQNPPYLQSRGTAGVT
jgi:hypothetical protein